MRLGGCSVKLALTMAAHTKFETGQLIHHKKFGYRGVIVAVDETFQGTEEWYEQVARSRPPKQDPWYQVLVHNSAAETYVAERHLQLDDSGATVDHPLIGAFFDELVDSPPRW